METRENRWSLLPSYDQLRDAIETLNAGLLVRTPNGKIVFANERMLEWTGYTPEELDGQDLSLLVPAELREPVEDEMRLIHAGDQRARIVVLLRKDGRTLPAVTFAHVMRDGEDIRSVVTVVLDLGEVQTARRLTSAPASGLAASLDRIAGELQTISLFTASGDVPQVAHDHPDLALLSPREREILAQLLAGHRAPAIGKHLFISPHTVRNHLKSMYRKLGVADQASLVERVRALAAGEDT